MCEELWHVVFAPGSALERIGPNCFYMTRIERIVIPKGVIKIECNAFKDCENLKEVVFEEESRLRTLMESAFWRCNSLAKISLPEGLKSIGDSVFQDCRNLKDIHLPEGLETIGEDCFWNSGLEEIIFPASVKEVGARAFYKCEHLKRVLLGEKLEKLSEKEVGGGDKYKGPAFVHSAVKNIMLLSVLKTVEAETFSWCENLKSV